jgi:dTMP kinase
VLDAELSDGIHAKAQKDRLESAGDVFHERTRQFFLELARRDPERYLVLNARASRDEIAAEVVARVAPLLTLARQR